MGVGFLFRGTSLLVVVIVALLLLPGTGTGLPRSATPQEPSSPLARTPSPAVAVAPRATGSAGTTVLFNGTHFDSLVDASWANAAMPRAVIEDPVTSELFVADGGSFCGMLCTNQVLSLFNSSGNTAEPVIVLHGGTYSGPDVTSWAYDPVHRHVLGFDMGRDTVLVFNATRDHTGVDSILVGSLPAGGAVDPQNNRLYVTNEVSNTVSVIDTATNAVVQTINVSSSPAAIVFDPADNYFYVGAANLTLLDASSGSVVKEFHFDPSALAYDPSDGDVYAAWGTQNLTLLNGTAEVGNLTVGSSPDALAYDPADGEMAVANQGSANVSMVSSATHLVTASFPVGTNPESLAYSPSSHELYVADSGVGGLSVVNATTFASVTSLVVGACPTTVALDPVTGDLLAPDDLAGGVYVLSPNGDQVLKFIPVGTWGSYFFLSPPSGVAYDPDSGAIALALPLSANTNLTLLDAATEQPLPLAPTNVTPSGVAYDPLTHTLVVGGSRGVAVLNASTYAEEAFLNITGVSQVAFDGSSGNLYILSGTSVLAFSVGTLWEVSGTSYAILASLKLYGDPDALTVDAAGSSTIVVGSWSGNVTVLSPATLSVVQQLVVTGAYGLSGNVEGVGYDPVHGDLWVSNDAAATVNVYDGSTFQYLTGYSTGSDPAGILALPGSGGMAVAAEAGGVVTTYQGAPGPILESVTVSPPTVPVYGYATFTAQATGGEGPLTYSYQGLPPGCTSQNLSSLYCSPTAQGSFTVNATVHDSRGNSVSASVTLVVTSPAFAVDVTITPSGCGPVTINGTSYTTESVGRLPIGSYALTYRSCSGYPYVAIWGGGNVSVSSSYALLTVKGNGSLSLQYSSHPFYTVSVTVSPVKCGAVVKLNGTTYSSGAQVGLHDGTYSLVAGTCPGYTFQSWSVTGGISVSGGMLVVSGNGTLVAQYVGPGGGSGGGPSGNTLLILLLGVVGLVVAIAIAVLVLRKRRRATANPPEAPSPEAPPADAVAAGPPSS